MKSLTTIFEELKSPTSIKDPKRITLIYRSNNKVIDGTYTDYTYDIQGDKWFRSTFGLSKGYGLLVKDLKITPKQKTQFIATTSERNAYPITLKLVNNEDASLPDWDKHYTKEKYWLIISNKEDVDNVIKDINKQSKNWTP
jgi:hypothetical protein